jgi:prevent-host-death family protein
MKTVTMHKAKSTLSQLVAEVEAGEEIVIMRGKVPAARLVGLDATPTRKFGALAEDEQLPLKVRRQGFTALPISMVHAQVAGALPGIDRDPFDRVLVAQAREERLALVSNETVFDDYGISRYW